MANNYRVVITIVGDTGVGKSSIIHHYNTGSYLSDLTRNSLYTYKEVVILGKKIQLELREYYDHFRREFWKTYADTPQERYLSGADGVILTYDISNSKSFDFLSAYMNDIEHFVPDAQLIFLVGNKSDLKRKREVDTERGKEFSLRHGMSFIETSGLTGKNIDILFETLIRLVLKKNGVKDVIGDNNILDSITPILVIGDSGVGKTCIWQSFKCALYSTSMLSNDVVVKVETIELVDHNHQHVKLNLEIIDIPGNKISDVTTMPHYSRAMGIILVYDITSHTSFDNITRWLQNIKANSSRNVQCILVGNKLDMESERQVPKERGEELAGKLKMLFYETSAKMNINIDEAFETLSRQILKVAEQEVSVFERITKVFQRKKSFAIDLQKPASSAVTIDKVKDQGGD